MLYPSIRAERDQGQFDGELPRSRMLWLEGSVYVRKLHDVSLPDVSTQFALTTSQDHPVRKRKDHLEFARTSGNDRSDYGLLEMLYCIPASWFRCTNLSTPEFSLAIGAASLVTGRKFYVSSIMSVTPQEESASSCKGLGNQGSELEKTRMPSTLIMI